MTTLLNSLFGGYSTFWCMDERLKSPQMSAKVHAPTVRQQVMASKKKAKLSINDQLRSLIGDMLSEKELEQRLTFGRVLGTGATSKVYEAVDTRTGEEVSVKVFDKAAMVEARRSMVADGNYVAEKAVHRVRRRLLKLVSELEISKSLDHPNIIKYVGAYETSHRICIIHELVEGSDLLEHLLANGKMPEDQAAGVFKQLLSALEYCHARNVFHRDLKLENVMITKDLKVKLIDFGLSEVVANPEQPLKTVCGTPLYCSPEILFLHTTAQTAREGFQGGPADVWSVGVLVFALLTGCAPFDDSDFKRLRRGISRNRINYPDYISDQTKGLLKAVLVTDPLMRPSVADLLGYGWFQDSDASPEDDTSVVTEKNAATQKMENDWLCAKRQGDNNDDIRCRSLSCRHASDLDGTYSSNASLEDSIKRCPSSPTHFSSMENEVEKGASKV